jgi:hypothetical protein
MGYLKQVENLGAAMAIAEEGKRSGKWDLFRGQTNGAWRVTSSAERLSEVERQSAFEQLTRFVSWAEDSFH